MVELVLSQTVPVIAIPALVAMDLNATALGFLTFLVMFGGSVLGYLSLRRHVRRIRLPEEAEQQEGETEDADGQGNRRES